MNYGSEFHRPRTRSFFLVTRRVVLLIGSWLLSSLVQALGLAPQLSNSRVKGPMWRGKSIHCKGFTPKKLSKVLFCQSCLFWKTALGCCCLSILYYKLGRRASLLEQCSSHSQFGIIHKHWNKYNMWDSTLKHISYSWASVRSMLVNGYHTDAGCGLCKYESMWSITSVNADARCG